MQLSWQKTMGRTWREGWTECTLRARCGPQRYRPQRARQRCAASSALVAVAVAVAVGRYPDPASHMTFGGREPAVQLRQDGISWQEIEGELVILDLERSVYLTTNVSGAFLSKLLVEDRTREELVSRLAEEFGIDEERAGADVDAFLEELSRRGLLA